MFVVYKLVTPKGSMQLLSGDMVVLERLLPNQPTVVKLGSQQEAHLDADEAGKLLTALQGLDKSSLNTQYYARSMGNPTPSTELELVSSLIAFLSGRSYSQAHSC